MSEQKQSSFMAELDRWTESTIIGPLFASETDGEDWEPAIERVKKAIRHQGAGELPKRPSGRAAPTGAGAEEGRTSDELV